MWYHCLYFPECRQFASTETLNFVVERNEPICLCWPKTISWIIYINQDIMWYQRLFRYPKTRQPSTYCYRQWDIFMKHNIERITTSTGGGGRVEYWCAVIWKSLRLNKSSRFLPEWFWNLTITNRGTRSRNSLTFTEPEGSLPCSQELANGPYPEPNASNPFSAAQVVLPKHRTTQHRNTQTHIHAPSRIRTCDLNVQAVVDSTTFILPSHILLLLKNTDRSPQPF
jgi:hypothetical protein